MKIIFNLNNTIPNNVHLVDPKEMVAATQANASVATTNFQVITGTTSKPPVFSGNHENDWTIWEMKMMAHLMGKGLDSCLDPGFETRLPPKENGPFSC